MHYWPHTPLQWVRAAQIFVGLFFMSAAAWKFFNYFYIGDQLLRDHAEFWLSSGWPPEWYAWFMRNVVQSHDRLFAALTILMQFIPGFCLVTNIFPRWGAFLLLVLQLNVYLGVYDHTNFNEFVGISVWIALFYTLKPKHTEEMNPWVWLVMRLLFAYLVILLMYNRWVYDDPWARGFEYQIDQLKNDIMSSSVYVKHTVIWLTQFRFMKLLWISKWWIKCGLAGLLLTRWRLQSAAIILVMQIGNVVIWMNGTTSQGVLWVLICYTYCTMEYFMQSVDKADPERRLVLPWLKKLQQRLPVLSS